jgi:sulfoxide reductase heme-binding subunit YedZ
LVLQKAFVPQPLLQSLQTLLIHRAAKPVAHAVFALPLLWLVFAAMTDRLGANPAEALVRGSGDWTLRCLCGVLMVTPLRVMSGLTALARFRRLCGLWVYAYASLHLLCYAWFDMELDLADITRDIAKRPFIWVGFSAFVLLTLLAATSFNRAVRWLGAAHWQQLHRLVYAVAGLAVLHFFWMRAGKHNFAEVTAYALWLGSLLGWRAVRRLRQGRH